jgi:hypothetical protein
MREVVGSRQQNAAQQAAIADALQKKVAARKYAEFLRGEAKNRLAGEAAKAQYAAIPADQYQAPGSGPIADWLGGAYDPATGDNFVAGSSPAAAGAPRKPAGAIPAFSLDPNQNQSPVGAGPWQPTAPAYPGNKMPPEDLAKVLRALGGGLEKPQSSIPLNPGRLPYGGR